MIEKVMSFLQKQHCTDEDFNEMALQLFRHQFLHNEPYQAFCRQRGLTPRLVQSWRDIPAVPIDAFKEVPLTCTPPDEAEAVFMTSGTTTGKRGKHYHPSLRVYDESMRLHFKERFMREDEQMPMGILFPSPTHLPNSSLAHYLTLAATTYSGGDYTYFVDEDGLQIESLLAELKKREQAGKPYALLGASFSFVHLFDALAKRNEKVTLPSGSRLLDTGGFKNESADIELDLFYTKMTKYLGVERKNCINMFGMSELSTQFYDDGNEVVPSVKRGPHWIRTRVVHPLSGEDVEKGKPGVLVHYDLANFNSVVAILTEDIGIQTEDGFEFIGRAEGADAKGCSLALDAFIKATEGGRS